MTDEVLDLIRNATPAQKSAMFEWLRRLALKFDSPDAIHAAVALQEIVDNLGKLKHALDNTDEALGQVCQMATIALRLCEEALNGKQPPREVWEERAACFRKQIATHKAIDESKGATLQ